MQKLQLSPDWVDVSLITLTNYPMNFSTLKVVSLAYVFQCLNTLNSPVIPGLKGTVCPLNIVEVVSVLVLSKRF